MPKGPAPQWRQRKEPVLDHVLQASVDQAGGKYDPQTGQYAEVHYRGIETADRAKEIVRSLHRSGRFMKLSVMTKTVRDGDGYKVICRAVNKEHARKYIQEKAGGDPRNLAYNPYARTKK